MPPGVRPNLVAIGNRLPQTRPQLGHDGTVSGSNKSRSFDTVPVDHIQTRWQQLVGIIHGMADYGPGAIQILCLSQELDWTGRPPEFLGTDSQAGTPRPLG